MITELSVGSIRLIFLTVGESVASFGLISDGIEIDLLKSGLRVSY